MNSPYSYPAGLSDKLRTPVPVVYCYLVQWIKTGTSIADEWVGTHEAKTHLSEYLNRVHYGGERIVIERHGKPVAALMSTEDLERLESSPGTWRAPKSDIGAV